jgi:hypothetical protein
MVLFLRARQGSGTAGMWGLSQLSPWQERLRAHAAADARARGELRSSEEVLGTG